VVLALRDVTELAGALQARTDFVANASHELRTPVAAIRLAMETLASSDDPALRARLVQMVTSQVSRLEELARDLLDLSRVESAEAPAQRTPLSPAELAAELAELFAPAADRRGVRLEFALDPGLEGMLADRGLLRRVLENLIDNAIKFARESTAVRVVGTVQPARVPRPGGMDDARFEVRDRGLGIPLSQQQRVFERFYQVDEARSAAGPGRGTGLGLSIVKHAARKMGGLVRVESVWKQGTTMVVDLPACVPGRGGAAGVNAPGASARPQGPPGAP
jgi:two-component system phosphate regulon sensor histidine kinase PhoR